MQIKYSPQRSDNTIIYDFDGETITATIGEKTDVFDFSAMPDGVMQDLQTTLPINPIVSARRTYGILYVKLLYYHGTNATHDELFPQWQEVGNDG